MEQTSSGLLMITSIIIIIYIIMLILKKFKIINIKLHKTILNLALLISFLICAYTGISYALMMDYGISIGEFDDHVSSGIAMIIIALIHIFERRWFFIGMLKFKKKNIQ